MKNDYVDQTFLPCTKRFHQGPAPVHPQSAEVGPNARVVGVIEEGQGTIEVQGQEDLFHGP